MRPKKNTTPASPVTEAPQEVEFSYAAPTANEVFLAGSFNNWNPTELRMKRDPEGVWQLRVPLTSGSHEYRFIADGVWNDDPCACAYVPNQFGWCNCVVKVEPPKS